LIKLSLQVHSTILFLIAEIIHAFIMSFLFMPLHEAIHNTAFESTWANKSLAWITGFLTTRFPKYYTIYHFPHHRYTGDLKRDPELLDTLIDMKLKTVYNYVVYLTGIPYWIDKVQTSIQLCQGTVNQPWVPERRKGELVSEARFFVSLYIGIAIWQLLTGSSFALYYWVLPSLLGQPFLRFYLIAEHTGCKDSLNFFENTRTTYTHWFYRKLAWNMPYHAEHHAYPLVPFHALDQVHELCLKHYNSKTPPCTPSGSNGYISVNKGIVAELSPHTDNKTQ